jgi:hypothetical protein
MLVRASLRDESLWATLCPLGQPKKAIGHEPLIGPWLATLRPSSLSVSGTDSAHHDRRITEEEANGTLRTEKQTGIARPSRGAGRSQNSSGSRLREESFSLDIPFNRTFREGDSQALSESRSATAEISTASRTAVSARPWPSTADISARGKGLVLRGLYPAGLCHPVVALLLLAN